MQVTVNIKELKKALLLVIPVIYRKPTLPVLKNVLLRTVVGESSQFSYLELVATDLESTITTRITAQVTECGSITVLPQSLLAIARASGKATNLTLQVQSEIVEMPEDKPPVLNYSVIVTPDGELNEQRVTIEAISAEDFPVRPDYVGLAVQEFKVGAFAFSTAIKQMAFAASTDETRPVMTGLWLEVDPTTLQLKLTAGDTFRLAHVELTVKETNLSAELKAIIPSKAMRTCAKLVGEIAKGGEELVIGVNEKQSFVVVKTGHFCFAISLIEGNIPGYLELARKESKLMFQVATKAILQVATLIAQLEKERVRANRFEQLSDILVFEIVSGDGSGDKLRLHLKVGTKDETPKYYELPVKVVRRCEVPFSIAFNIRYVLEMAQSVTTEYLQFEFEASEWPGVVRTVGSSYSGDDNKAIQADKSLHLLMPMHLSRC